MAQDENSIRLDFTGPFRWFGTPDQVLFNQPVADQSGIYIWGVMRPNGLLIYYVGETGKSFKARHKAHLREYLNGYWVVYNPDTFVNGNKEIIWGGLKQSKKCGPEEWSNRKEELTPKIKSFLSTLYIFFAPITLEKLVRQRIESAIAAYLKSQEHPIGKFIDPDMNHLGKPNLSELSHVDIHFPMNVLGLPTSLDVFLPKREI